MSDLTEGKTLYEFSFTRTERGSLFIYAATPEEAEADWDVLKDTISDDDMVVGDWEIELEEADPITEPDRLANLAGFRAWTGGEDGQNVLVGES